MRNMLIRSELFMFSVELNQFGWIRSELNVLSFDSNQLGWLMLMRLIRRELYMPSFNQAGRSRLEVLIRSELHKFSIDLNKFWWFAPEKLIWSRYMYSNVCVDKHVKWVKLIMFMGKLITFVNKWSQFYDLAKLSS